MGGDGAGGKKRCEAQHVSMVELTGLDGPADGPDASCETEKRNKCDLQVLL